MIVIEEGSIKEVVQEPEALLAAESAFRALGEGRAEIPAPMALRVPEADGEVHVKSAYLSGSAVFAIKIASGFYSNAERGLPSGSGVILIFDAETGFPLALLDDGGYLTELRTAAAGALAAKHLAVEAPDTVAVLGTGTQARYQLRALRGVRRWRRTLAWSRDPEHVRAYCGEMEAELDGECVPAPDAHETVREADLVITVTPSRKPLIEASWLQPHATVIAVGSDGPDKRELPTEALIMADKVVVDRLSQCLELGELHHAVAEGALQAGSVYAELGEIVGGRKPGRTDPDELIVCDLTGVGAQDAAIAEVAWEKLGALSG